MKDNFARLAQAVMDRGYTPIPCSGKRPIAMGWQHTAATQEALNENLASYPQANVGILTGERIVVIDVDCPSEPVTQRVVKWVRENIGEPLIRYGKDYKVALLFQTETPQRKQQSPSYMVEGVKHQIEVLGVGQQFIAYGIHPDTRKPYTWAKGRGPADVDLSSLPVCSEIQIANLLGVFENSIMPRGQTPVSKAKALDGFDEVRDPFENVKTPRRDVTQEQISEALKNVTDNVSHDNWIKIGHALHHQFEGTLDGLALWDLWSQSAPNYCGYAECRRRWDSFHASGYSGTVTLSTVLAQARENGWVLKTQAQQQRETNFAQQASEGTLFEWLSPVDPSTIPARGRLYGRAVMRGYVTGLVSPGGVSKSTYALHMAASLVTERPLLGEEVHTQCRVMVLNYEDDTRELQRRLSALCLHHGLDQGEVFRFLRLASWYGKVGHQLAHDNGTEVTPTKLVDHLIDEIRRENIAVLILDPFVAIHNAPENDNTKLNAVMTVLKRIASEGNCAVVLVHHTPKGSGRDTEAHAGSADVARGASAIKDAVRSMITLARMSDETMSKHNIPPELGRYLVRLDTAKANYAPPDTEATWFKLISVKLPNDEAYLGRDGDLVGAMEPFDLSSYIEDRKESNEANTEDLTNLLQIAENMQDGERMSAVRDRLMPMWKIAETATDTRIKKIIPEGKNRGVKVTLFDGSLVTIWREAHGDRSPITLHKEVQSGHL